MFEAAEIGAMLTAASIQMKAMILLGVNCGFTITTVARYRSLLSILMADGLIFRDRKRESHAAVRCGLNWSTRCVQPSGPAQNRKIGGTRISYS